MALPTAQDNGTSAEPLVEEPERLLPRISILSLIGLITLCAVVFWAIRTGFQGNLIALKSLVVVIALVLACFVSYALLFLLTYLCSLVIQPLLVASGQSFERPRAALPTETLPAPSRPPEPPPETTSGIHKQDDTTTEDGADV
ncbi:hypothetical protein [Roseimaritima ulvae]|uniref:Uncharacterized protein n=1 Tax=Roseimaritima ulvae TaxID=980254 RepID=A0A5B9R234_9BACT|nr:hypothetical protein [Roseimaritima ulvae]QEG40291.1 hypothetical protein UC8_22980 [Roseimaritima ulvae]